VTYSKGYGKPFKKARPPRNDQKCTLVHTRGRRSAMGKGKRCWGCAEKVLAIWGAAERLHEGERGLSSFKQGKRRFSVTGQFFPRPAGQVKSEVVSNAGVMSENGGSSLEDQRNRRRRGTFIGNSGERDVWHPRKREKESNKNKGGSSSSMSFCTTHLLVRPPRL